MPDTNCRYYSISGDIVRVKGGGAWGDILLTDRWNEGVVNPAEIGTHGMPLDNTEAARRIKGQGGDPAKLME